MTTQITMKHDSGVTKTAYEGFSWTGLFFGWCVPLLRGDMKWFLISVVVALINYGLCTIGIGVATSFIWWILFAVKYNEWQKNDLLLAGFKVV